MHKLVQAMHSTGKDPVYMPGGRALDGLIAFDPNGRVTTGVFYKVYWTEQNPGAVDDSRIKLVVFSQDRDLFLGISDPLLSDSKTTLEDVGR